MYAFFSSVFFYSRIFFLSKMVYRIKVHQCLTSFLCKSLWAKLVDLPNRKFFFPSFFSVSISVPYDVTSSLKIVMPTSVISMISDQFLWLQGNTAHFLHYYYSDQWIHYIMFTPMHIFSYQAPSDSIFPFVDSFSLFSHAFWSLSDLIATSFLQAHWFLMMVFSVFVTPGNFLFHLYLISMMISMHSWHRFPIYTHPICCDRTT